MSIPRNDDGPPILSPYYYSLVLVARLHLLCETIILFGINLSTRAEEAAVNCVRVETRKTIKGLDRPASPPPLSFHHK